MSSLRASALLETSRGLGVAGSKRAPTLTGEHVQECARQEQRPNAHHVTMIQSVLYILPPARRRCSQREPGPRGWCRPGDPIIRHAGTEGALPASPLTACKPVFFC